MKKNWLILFILSLFLTSFIMSRVPKGLLAKWTVSKVKHKDGSISNISKKYIRFLKNGTMKTPIGKGKWNYDKQNNLLIIGSNEGSKNHDDGSYKIISLSKNELVLEKDSVVVYLIK